MILKFCKSFISLLLISSLLFFTNIASAFPNALESASLLLGLAFQSMHPGYHIKNDQVYFKDCNAGDGCTVLKMPEANPKTFEILEKYGYAKDNQHVYYRQHIVKDANPKTFKAINDIWGKDKNHAYLYGQLVKNVNPKYLRVLSTPGIGYQLAVDNQSIIYDGIARPACDPDTVHEIKNSAFWQADRKCLYYQGVIVENGEPESFQSLNPNPWIIGYDRDKNHVYYFGKPIPSANPQTFSVINQDFAKDHQHVYYDGKILEKAAPDSFVIISPLFEKDQNQVYFDGKLIKQANAQTFQLFNDMSQYSKDQQHVFYGSHKIKNAHPKYFKILGAGYAKNNHHIYFQGKMLTGIKDIAAFKVLAGYCAQDKNHFYSLDDGSVLSVQRGKDCLKWYKENNIAMRKA